MTQKTTMTNNPPKRLTGKLHVYWNVRHEYVFTHHAPLLDTTDLVLLDDSIEYDADLTGAADLVEAHKTEAIKQKRDNLLAELAELEGKV